jgi:alpha-L-rhamnosidase
MNAGYDEWFFRGIAGIHPDEKAPGYKKIVFRPYFTSKLKHASATYESPYGTIVSSWKIENEHFTWDLKIPANCGADLYIPKLFEKQQITVNGQNQNLNLIEDPYCPGFYLWKPGGNGSFHIVVVPER